MTQNPKQREDFRDFVDWCSFYGFAMPVNANVAAAYLLEKMDNREPLPSIKRAARSIAIGYEQRKCFLDPVPIRAALALAAAQLSPNRVIN
jgi:hypothetical protein